LAAKIIFIFKLKRDLFSFGNKSLFNSLMKIKPGLINDQKNCYKFYLRTEKRKKYPEIAGKSKY